MIKYLLAILVLVLPSVVQAYPGVGGPLIDPRNYGATCAGATFSGGIPHRVGSHDDTQGFVAAQFVAASTGGAVMVPDGCWVANLPMLSGVSLIGQNWAPNYGYDYGNGSIGYTLNITAGSGYTNGTYLLQTSNAPVGASGFDTGQKGGQGHNSELTSSTSITIATGTQTFTVSASTGTFSTSTPVLIYDNTTVSSSGVPTNYMFGTVTSYSGTTLVANITTIGGSGTISTWNVRNPNYIVVSGGALGTANQTGYQVNSPGSSYNISTRIPVPTAAGAGTGGAIGTYIRNSGTPLAKPVMYIIDNPSFGINVNGSETVAFVGFEVNGFAASTTTACIGDDSASQGFGGKIWLYQMSVKGCSIGFSGSSSCFDYLVSENTDYAGNTTGIGGCFSDFLSFGDTFASGTVGIQGSGGGFARISNDRFEYLTNGISPGSVAFLELSIDNTQFDHFDQCAINLGTTWNQITITGGALKGGGIAGSLTVTDATDYGDGNIQLAVTSAIDSLHGGQAATTPFRKVATVIDTAAANVTIGTGAKTITTTLSDALHSRISGTDGVVVAGSTTFTSASSTFTGGGDVGDILNITSCTGTGCQTGFYRVLKFVSTHVLVLDRTPTDGVNNMSASTFTAAVPLLIYDNSAPTTSWEYGTVTSDASTSLVMNITSVKGSGNTITAASAKFGRPYWANVKYVGGTDEANGNNWIITAADTTHMVLQNSTFSNAYTSGGFAGVQTMDADICLGANSAGNKANQLTISNVSFDSPKALGQAGGPAYIIESSNQGGVNGDYIGFFGGSLIRQGQDSNVSVNYTSYTIGIENWIIAPPTHYYRGVLGAPVINPFGVISQGSTFSVSGCSAATPIGGPVAGQFVSGSSATCTFAITMGDSLTATHGWVCSGSDLTTGTTLAQSASTTTTASLTGATTSGDIVVFSCPLAY